MKSRYLSNPDYNFEKVNRASMACGPLVKWATAQVQIKTIVELSFNTVDVKRFIRSNYVGCFRSSMPIC